MSSKIDKESEDFMKVGHKPGLVVRFYELHEDFFFFLSLYTFHKVCSYHIYVSYIIKIFSEGICVSGFDVFAVLFSGHLS